ncbi:MAG: glycosyltransferase [Candidatus Diapherotrites archaeon]
MNPKILIGCPIHDGRKDIIDEFIESLNSLSYENKEILLIDNSKGNEMFEKIKGRVDVIKSEHTGNAMEMLARDRNTLREKCLNEGFDYFFSLEQDVFPPKDVIEKLLENKKKNLRSAVFQLF